MVIISLYDCYNMAIGLSHHEKMENVYTLCLLMYISNGMIVLRPSRHTGRFQRKTITPMDLLASK